MKGLKSKLLIAFLIVIAMVLGYQAFVMAEGCGTVFPRTSDTVPFISNGHLILCREHTNGFKGQTEYKCQSEYKINADEKEDKAAHGMAYFLYFGSKDGKNYGNEIQAWIWNNSKKINANNNGNILHVGSDFIGAFKEDITGSEIENFQNFLENVDSGNLGIENLKDALESKTVAVVDEYSSEFFTTVGGVSDAKDNDTRITDISFEEYNYLYQLHYVLNYIYSRNGEVSAEDLKNHTAHYVSEMGMTIYKGDIPTNTDLNQAPAVLSVDNDTIDYYGLKIKLTVLDLNADGKSQPHAYMWQYVDEEGNADDTIYYADDTYGTTKFSDRVLLGKDNMLENYIKLYNGTYSIDNLVSDLKAYSESKVEFDNLANILKTECEGKTGEELYNKVHSIVSSYKEKVTTIAENANKQETTGATIKNPGNNEYEFTGTTLQAAKVYQWLVNNDILVNCSEDIGLNKDGAKVAIDTKHGGNYIVGPLSLDYYTVKLNDEEVLGLTNFEIILLDEDGDKTFSISATKDSLIIDEKDIVTKKVDGKTVSIPKSGASFYVQISQSEVKDLIGRTLTSEDSIGVRGTYKYLDYIKATIHFLEVGKNGDGDDDKYFNRRHPQRLMTYDAEPMWKDTTVEDTLNPHDTDLQLTKTDGDGELLEGAVFYIVGNYKDSHGNIRYFDLDTLTKDYGTTLTEEIIDNELNGKELTQYETPEDGTIRLTNKIYSTIRYNNEEYQLVGFSYKEIKAPNGYKIVNKNWQNHAITWVGQTDIIGIPVENDELSYDLDILKLDNKEESIENLTLKYKFFEVGNENRETDYMTATTDQDGKVTFEDIKLFNNVPDSNGNYSELVALQIEETGEVANQYKYFRAIQVVYKVTITNNDNITIEFFDYNTADASTKTLWENWEKVTGGEFNKNVINGVSNVVDCEGVALTEEEIENEEYIRTAYNGIDITIINDDLNEEYSLTINKVTVENGELVTSEYLKDTKFQVHIGKDGKYLLEDEITIGDDGKGTLENIEIYSDNAEDYLYLYLEEIPNPGFKTDLTGEDKDPVLKFTATKTGEITIYKDEIASNKLDPIGKIEDGEEVKVENELNINITAVNEPEEYKLRFRKVSESGIPLSNVTFKLEGEGYSREAESDDNGYMTFEGLNHTGEVTLSLYETKPKEGYYSENNINNPITITYTYHAGSGKLENLTIADKNITYLAKGELPKSETDNGILFDFGTLNDIFKLVNKPNPYDVQFIKIGDDNLLLNGKKFEVSIYTLEDGTTKKYATNTNGEINKVEVESDNGIVLVEKVNEYGEFYVEIEEIPDANSDYETLEDTLRISYSIYETENERANELVWGTKLEILDENGTVVKEYDRKSSDSTNFGVYDYVKVEQDELYVINNKKSYDLDIHKTDSMNVGLENIEFSAIIYKEGTSESISLPNDDSYNLITDANGKTVISNIDIYSTEEYPTITLALTEKNIPEGYKWHEYGSITYIYEYEKYSANDSIKYISGKIIANVNPESNETIDLETGLPNPFDVSTLKVINYPEATLDLFDGKAVVEDEEVNLEEVDLSKLLIESGIEFTAEVKYSNEVLQEDVKVTLNKEGIVAHNIELYPQFIQNNEYKVQGLQLVLTEVYTPGLVKIDPITIEFNCEYDATNKKLNTEKTAYIYQGETYKIEDIQNTSDTNLVVIDGIVYVDTKGRHILVNQSEPVTELKIKKVDDSGKAINGIVFVGKIVNEDNEEIPFTTTTDTDGIDGIDGIGKIEIGFADKEKVLGHTVKVVIEDEYWAEGATHENSELEFIDGNITISGIEIAEDGTVIFPDTVKIELEDDKYVKQVEIDRLAPAIKVTNNKETYDIPMVKTSSDLSQNEDATRLQNVVFNFSIKDANAEDSEAKTFSGITTDAKGEICLEDIDIFGENLVLTIEEIKPYPGTLILDEIVEVHYSAELIEGEVVLTFKEAIKQNSEATEENVMPIINDDEQFIGINVINTMDYSIVLHKKMNVNGTMTEITSADEKVIFKGIVTANPDLAINDKAVGTLSKEELENFVDGLGTTDFITEIEEYEDTKFFRITTDSEHMAEIDKLVFYDKYVNVYFVEELVKENSSMTEIEDVMKVSFWSDKEDITDIVAAPSDSISINDDNRLKIEVTVINDAIAYKAKIRKVDSIDGEVMNLAGAEFKFTLSELATSNGLSTLDSDTVTVTFDSTGEVSDDVEYGKYIVGADRDDDGYIVLDINKYGEKLQLQIEELKAPANYIKINEILSVSYTATAGEISNVSSEKLEAKAMEGNVLGLDIELPNTPEPYDLPIYKKVTDGSAIEPAGSEDAIKFSIKFFDMSGQRIMTDKDVSYSVEAGKVTVRDIDTFGTYYMAIEETDSSDSVVRIEGIQVFEITASPEDKVSKIQFVGTGTINGEGELMIDENNKKYEKAFDCEDETQAGLARLEIKNNQTKDYSIDFTKIDENGNPLNGAEFEVYLTEQDENYLTAINKLDKKEYTTGTIGDSEDGKIIIPELRFIGDYKITIIETKPPVGMEKAFDKVEILYSTDDGYDITVTAVYIDGVITDSKDIVKYNSNNKASIKIQLVNYTLQPVPIKIHKVYYDEAQYGQMVQLPIENVVFAGKVTDKYGNTHEFANIETNEDGYANIGNFRVDGEVKVEIREISAPAGFDKIPKTTIKLQVNNEEMKIEDYTVGQNTLAEITDDNALVIADRETITPTISLAGIVWEDYRNNLKEDASYTKEGYYTEGLYDENIDKLINGINVRLYNEDGIFIKGTTTESGAYSFDELDPFQKYYITFKYDGENYESVKYLVKGVENGKVVSYRKISDAIDKEGWENNSKAITNSENIATTVTDNNSSSIQCYPAYDQFIIDNTDGEKFTLYYNSNTGKYTLNKIEDEEPVTFKPLNPAHQHINLGLKLKNAFDLSLSKDVYSMIVKLKNCTANEYLYNNGADHKMYILKLTPEDINILEQMSIIYTIEVRNEDLATGKLESIVEYYNSDLLTFCEAKIEGTSATITGKGKNAANVKIPEQTYSYRNDEYSKNNIANNTGRVEIPINKTLEANDTITIKVQYNYNIGKLQEGLKAGGSLDVGNQYITLGIAEIMGSKANNGRQDKDSNADSLDSIVYDDLSDLYIDDGETSYYIDIKEDIQEDDASTAPAAKIIVDQNTRTISGNVFDDINANGKLDENAFVNGVKVKLVNEYTGEETSQTIDNADGYYCFTNIAAGTYHIEFTYGDENTVLPVLTIRNAATGEVEKVEEDKVETEYGTYPRQNQKSYNAFEFESTNYIDKTVKLYWFKNEAERLSDARDKEESRRNADSNLNGTGTKESLEDSKTYYQMNNKKAEQLYSYMGDSGLDTVQDDIKTLAENAVTAATDSFVIEPENTNTHKLQYEEYESGAIYLADVDNSGNVSSNQVTPNSTNATNIDFGIKARPQSDITVEKEVENVKIYTAAGNITVDVVKDDNGEVRGERAKVQWRDGTPTKAGQIWVQRSDEEITAAKLEITYKITVKNNTNYEVIDEYDPNEIILTVADYIQDELTYSPAKNEGRGWNEVQVSSIKDARDVITSSAVGNVEINNHIDLTSVKKVVTQDVHLDSENDYEGELFITLTKTLNSYSNTDADAYTNYVEVIQTASQYTAKKDSNSIPGNYDPVTKTVTPGNLGRIVTGLDAFGLEKDTAQAKERLIITAETGENRQTYYILAISVIAVFATGVILIKKKVLDR